jgi:hypothetical protein
VPNAPTLVSKVGVHFGDLQAAIVADALSLLDQALRRGRSSPEAWRDAVQSIGTRLLTLQVQSATYADAYLNDILKAQGADGAAEGRVNPQAWADLTDGGGSWLQGLVFAPNSVRLPGVDWWTRFQFVAGSIVKTGLGDTAGVPSKRECTHGQRSRAMCGCCGARRVRGARSSPAGTTARLWRSNDTSGVTA